MTKGSVRVGGDGQRLHVLLDGPYGEANLGDNAIAYCMSRFLQMHGVDVTISCLDPAYIEASFGLKAVPMLDFRRFETSVLKEIREFDAVIIGGGQQLKEYRIPNPLVGMFARVCHMARAAEMQGIPFVAWSVGLDWPISAIAKVMARRYLGGRNATLILRDRVSFERVARLFYDKPCQVLQNKDAAFMLPALLQEAELGGNRHGDSVSPEKRLLICPSVIENDGALARLIDLCVVAAQEGYEVRGWHSEIRANYDPRVREIAAWDSIPGFRWLPPDPIDTPSVAELIRSASIVVTTRMHPAIIAVSQCVPAYGIATNGKMRSVFEELMLPYTNSDELEALSFTDILRHDFRTCFARAAAFREEAELGGLQVLRAIRGQTSATTDVS